MSVMLDIQILGRDGSRVNDTRVLRPIHTKHDNDNVLKIVLSIKE